ncbi:MAG: AMP-binding protein, partial [bacterium]|nr:AMP-binding protein [bacterium]
MTQAETGETLTYSEFDRLANRIAHGLRALGVERGDYVGIMLAHSVSFLAASSALN